MNKEGTKILVVEDEIIIADHLSDSLTSLGYETTEVALNYHEAIELIDSEKPDLVFLDINLGGKKSGVDIAEYLSESGETPYIFLTSYTDSSTLETALETYPYGFLAKPYKIEDLAPAIEVALANSRRNRRKRSAIDWSIFTESELAVLRKISINKTTKEIAEELFVSPSTIKNHRHNICKKLDLPQGNNSLTNWVLRSGIDL